MPTMQAETIVRFPRFEGVANPDAPIAEQTLEWHVQDKVWVDLRAVRHFFDLAGAPNRLIPGKVDFELFRGYAGVYHTALQGASKNYQREILGGNDSHDFWLLTSLHNASIAADRFPVSALEVVLIENTRRGKLREHAALLLANVIGEHGMEQPTQGFVVNNVESGWHEPCKEELLRAESLLASMSHIAHQEAMDIAMDNKVIGIY